MRKKEHGNSRNWKKGTWKEVPNQFKPVKTARIFHSTTVKPMYFAVLCELGDSVIMAMLKQKLLLLPPYVYMLLPICEIVPFSEIGKRLAPFMKRAIFLVFKLCSLFRSCNTSKRNACAQVSRELNGCVYGHTVCTQRKCAFL